MPNHRKEHLSRPRDERRRDASRTVTGTDDKPLGPSLYELTGRPASDWHPRVVAWFDAWRRSPQARLFVGRVEWESLGRCAFLLEQYYDPACSPSLRVRVWSAISRQESSLGATHADRTRAGIKVKPMEPAAASAPTPNTDYYRGVVGIASDEDRT